jgi:hypothetical protein
MYPSPVPLPTRREGVQGLGTLKTRSLGNIVNPTNLPGFKNLEGFVSPWKVWFQPGRFGFNLKGF